MKLHNIIKNSSLINGFLQPMLPFRSYDNLSKIHFETNLTEKELLEKSISYERPRGFLCSNSVDRFAIFDSLPNGEIYLKDSRKKANWLVCLPLFFRGINYNSVSYSTYENGGAFCVRSVPYFFEIGSLYYLSYVMILHVTERTLLSLHSYDNPDKNHYIYFGSFSCSRFYSLESFIEKYNHTNLSEVSKSDFTGTFEIVNPQNIYDFSEYHNQLMKSVFKL